MVSSNTSRQSTVACSSGGTDSWGLFACLTAHLIVHLSRAKYKLPDALIMRSVPVVDEESIAIA